MKGNTTLQAAWSAVILACSCLAPMSGIAQAPSVPSAKKALQDTTLEAQILLDEYFGNGAQLREAASLVDKVLQQDPVFVPAYVQAARVVLMGGYLHSNKYRGGTLEIAEQILTRASQLDPKHADTFTLLGNVHTVAGRLDEAQQSLNIAQRLGSHNPWTQVNLADLYMMQKKYNEAQSVLAPVIMNARTDTAQQRKAYIAALEKQRKMALWAGRFDIVHELGELAVVAAAPHDAWTLGNYAADLWHSGDFDGAIAQARAALKRMDYGAGRETLAQALYGKWAQLSRAGKHVEAEKLFSEAVKILPDLEEAASRFDADPEYLTVVRDLLLERARQQKPPA